MTVPPPMRRVGRYDLLREIGRGGMAVVYLARQIELARLVALKELSAFHAKDPTSARRFLNESRLAGSLTHANIVTVYEYFEQARLPYISMEYARHGSLRPLVGRLTLPQAIGVLASVLNGLTCAEEHGIVHRDLKPANLMLGDDGNVKIADFGIARAINQVTTLGVHTATGTTIGTPDYMAPEQAAGQPVTSATDRYSLGVIAYELLTGRKPFEGDSPVSILVKHVNDPLPPPQSVNPALDSELAVWITRLLEKEPEDRIPSARQALEELEDIAIRLQGPRWRRLAAPPDPRQSTRPDRSKALHTFDTGRAVQADLNESSEPVDTGPDGGVPATTGGGQLTGLAHEAAKAPGKVAEEAAVPVPEPPEADDTTIPPHAARPPTPLDEPAEEVGAGRQGRGTERAASRRWRRWWWAWAALFAVAAGGALAAVSLLGGREAPVPTSTGSSTLGVSPPPKRVDVGTYTLEVPAGWSCYHTCAEHANGKTAIEGFRLKLVGPAVGLEKPSASVDRYPLEPNTTLRDVSTQLLGSLRRKYAVGGKIRTNTSRGRLNYSFATNVRQFAGSIWIPVAGDAYHVQVAGFSQNDVTTIRDKIVQSLRPKHPLRRSTTSHLPAGGTRVDISAVVPRRENAAPRTFSPTRST